MSMLNFDQDRAPTFQLEQGPDQVERRPDFRSYYEKLAIQTLLSMRRHWFFIALPVVLAALAALIVIPVMPRKYSATAFVVPSLYSQEQAKTVALASVEATAIVHGEARLLVSDTILRAVVQRLWPNPRPERASAATWLRTMFFPETQTESPFDRQVSALRNKLSVVKDTRSYLIAISTTASAADEAARIVNAVGLEYLRSKLVQRRRDAVIAAELALTREHAVYGEKHPKFLEAVEALDVARNDLKAATGPGESGQDTARTDEGIGLAAPNHIPTSPKGTVILGLALVLGLLAGIGLAIWRDRRGLKPIDLVSGRQLTAMWRDRLAGRLPFSRRPQVPGSREYESPACETGNDASAPLPLLPARPQTLQTKVQVALKLPKDNHS